MTLEEAKQWLRDRFDRGARCPCCDQFVKLYKRPLNASMAYVLILIYRHPTSSSEWLHIPSFIAQAASGNARRAAAVRGDWAKLRFWGLLEEQPSVRDDGSNRVGYYRITELGQRFVQAQVRVPTHIHLYNEQPVNRPVETTVSIVEALGKKFSYSDLMAGRV